jgi:hypothetical protein
MHIYGFKHTPFHCVWYRRIREERNWGERDRREIAHFSSLADKRNKRERV